MNFNKCCRCGSFYITSGDVCPNCVPKDLCEISNLKNFFNTSTIPDTIDDIALSTGISAKNINRFFKDEQFSDISKKFKNGII